MSKRAGLSRDQIKKVLSNREINPLLRQTIHLLEKGELGKSPKFLKPRICSLPVA